MAGWPSGLRRWFKAPVTSVARVRIPLLSMFFTNFYDHNQYYISNFPKVIKNYFAYYKKEMKSMNFYNLIYIFLLI